jgi:hypothetical protein
MNHKHEHIGQANDIWGTYATPNWNIFVKPIGSAICELDHQSILWEYN